MTTERLLMRQVREILRLKYVRISLIVISQIAPS
jgi:hypothetical protein